MVVVSAGASGEGWLCCAQQTGMHILVVEALLIAIYSTGERANTYTQKKILSVENLSRANSWSLSSCACPAGSCPAGSLSSCLIPAVVYEPANGNRHAAYSQQAGPRRTSNVRALGMLSPRVMRTPLLEGRHCHDLKHIRYSTSESHRL